MGHSSTRAALIYLHSTGDRQRTLADALGQLAQTGLANNKGKATRSPRRRSGPEVARRRRAPRARVERGTSCFTDRLPRFHDLDYRRWTHGWCRPPAMERARPLQNFRSKCRSKFLA
jgi:hypothetical protein